MDDNQKQPYVVSSKSRVAVAINAASKTGEWIKSKLGDYRQLNTKTSSQDLVTEVDKGAEQMIRKLVQTYCSGDEFLGEESAGVGAEASIQATEAVKDAEYVWIVDPIDGTTNFVHGFPYYCVSIAVAHKGEVIIGVVYDPTHDEMFVAEKGKGAYVHGNLMQVAKHETLAESLVATGFPANAGVERNTRALVHMVPKVRSIRNGGSAALHLAYVAAGRLDAYWEVGLNAWDLAAGALLVQEAGGTIGDISGKEYDLTVRNVAASNGHIHNELLDELHHAGLTRITSDELERELSERLMEGQMEEEERDSRERRMLSSKYEIRIQTEHDPIVEETLEYRKLAKELDDRYDEYLDKTKRSNDDK